MNDKGSSFHFDKVKREKPWITQNLIFASCIGLNLDCGRQEGCHTQEAGIKYGSSFCDFLLIVYAMNMMISLLNLPKIPRKSYTSYKHKYYTQVVKLSIMKFWGTIESKPPPFGNPFSYQQKRTHLERGFNLETWQKVFFVYEEVYCLYLQSGNKIVKCNACVSSVYETPK